MDFEELREIIREIKIKRREAPVQKELPSVSARSLRPRSSHYIDHFPREITQEDSDRRYHGRGYE